MSADARVVNVRLLVEELWAARGDGRFTALEGALIKVYKSKRKNLSRAESREPLPQAAQVSRSNVIFMADRILERRRATR